MASQTYHSKPLEAVTFARHEAENLNSALGKSSTDASTIDTVPYDSLPVDPLAASLFLSSHGRTVHRCNQFIAIMDKFKDGSPDPAVRNFDIRKGHHSWKSVLETANAAVALNEAKRKGPLGIFSRLGEKVAGANDFIQPALSLLPCGEYTSVVCGGIKLLFNATIQIKEVREKVMAFLKEAPSFLEQAEIYQSLYQRDAALDETVQYLGVALLTAIEAFVGWFGKGWTRPFLAILKQKEYGKELEVLDQDVQRWAAKVAGCADTCDKQVTLHIGEVADIILLKVGMMLNSDQEIQNALLAQAKGQEDVAELAKLTNRAIQDVQSQLSRMENLFTTFVGQNAATQQSVVWQKEAADAKRERDETRRRAEELEQQLRDQAEIMRRQSLRHAEARRQIDLEYGRAAIPQDDIKRWLGNLEREHISDVQYYIDVARISDADPGLTQQILAHPAFLSWYNSRESQILFVDALRNFSGISSGSMFIATLSQTLQGQEHAVVLSYFCGRAPEAGSDVMVTDMLASMICQLLAAWPNHFDLRWWSRQRDYDEHCRSIGVRDLVYLCSLFKHVLTQVPYGAVFVLIDDYHLLERYNGEAALYLYRKLREIAVLYSEAQGRTFKVLVMTPVPNGCGMVSQHVPRRDLLQIHDFCLDGNREDSMLPQERLGSMHSSRAAFAGPYSAGFGVFGDD